MATSTPAAGAPSLRVSQLRFEVSVGYREVEPILVKICMYISDQSRIGVGSRGQIFRATDEAGGLHAVKVLPRDDGDTNIEIAALRRVQGHPNIITVEGPVEYSAESAFVILEHCETDLLEVVMASESGLPVEQASFPFGYSKCPKTHNFFDTTAPEPTSAGASVLCAAR